MRQVCGDSYCESRMLENCMSGSTRGEPGAYMVPGSPTLLAKRRHSPQRHGVAEKNFTVPNFSILLVAERDDRVHAAGAACRQPHRDQSHQAQQNRDADEDHGVPGLNTKEEGGDEARE